MNTLHPVPEHKFAFGLWTIGNRGRDPFGDAVRPPIEACEFVHRLGDLGAWGVSFHDDDLVPPDATPASRDDIVARFRKALDASGLVVSMATTNLCWHPAFKDGAFTASDRDVRRYAIQKAMRAIDLGAELGAHVHVFWGGREGTEAVAAKPLLDTLARYREAIDFLCGYVRDRGYATRFALEPKPGDTFLPTVGHALALIPTLDQPEMVGVSPKVAHETTAGLTVHHGVAQAIDAGKLFHISLNAQQVGHDDRDLRFGSAGIKEAFFLVKLLEESGYDGPRHFEARPYRVEDTEGAWDFAVGCMRTYLALAAKARRFADDPQIQDALEECGATTPADATIGCYRPSAADDLATEVFDLEVLAKRGYRNEHLDQLVVELILGLR